MTVAAAEIHASHLSDILHAGLEYFCLLIDTMSINVGRLTAKASLLSRLLTLQVLSILAFFPHPGYRILHMLHLHPGHLPGCLVADVSICAHGFTLNLEAKKRCLLILQIVPLGLFFRQPL